MNFKGITKNLAKKSVGFLLGGLSLILMACPKEFPYQKTTIKDLLYNPSEYTSKRVAVEGQIESPNYPWVISDGERTMVVSESCNTHKWSDLAVADSAIKKEFSDGDNESVIFFGRYREAGGAILGHYVLVEGELIPLFKP